MDAAVSHETKRLDHLGIVAGICQAIGLADLIDAQVGPNSRQVSVGQATQAMVLNCLGFSSRAINLTRVANWLMGDRPEAVRPSPFAALAAQY